MPCEPGCPFLKNGTCTDTIRLFREFPEDARKSLREKAVHASCRRQEYIVHEGDDIHAVLILRHGEVKTSVTDENGTEHVYDLLHGGHAIWHGMFLREHRYTYDVIAVSDVELCMIYREDFMRVLHENEETAMYLIEMLSSELQEANEKIALLSIRSPKIRLARFLLFHEKRSGEEIHMKLEDIANSICLRPETVSRNIVLLEKKNLIRRTGHGKIRILDRDGLKELDDGKAE